MNKIIKFFTRRLVLVSLLILVQFLLIAATLMLPGKRYFAIYYLTTWVMGVIFMFRIINRKDNPVYKIGWLIIVLLLPPSTSSSAATRCRRGRKRSSRPSSSR